MQNIGIIVWQDVRDKAWNQVSEQVERGVTFNALARWPWIRVPHTVADTLWNQLNAID